MRDDIWKVRLRIVLDITNHVHCLRDKSHGSLLDNTVPEWLLGNIVSLNAELSVLERLLVVFGLNSLHIVWLRNGSHSSLVTID